MHPGVHIYRYDWHEEGCVLYVAEMDRSYTDLHFEAAIANDQILGKETVRSIAIDAHSVETAVFWSPSTADLAFSAI